MRSTPRFENEHFKRSQSELLTQEEVDLDLEPEERLELYGPISTHELIKL